MGIKKRSGAPAPFERLFARGRRLFVPALAALTTAKAAALATVTSTSTTTTAKPPTLAAAKAATLTAAKAAPRGALFLRTGLVDRQLTASNIDAIGFLSRVLGFFRRPHGHERETTRATGHAVKGDINVGNGPELLEVSTELIGSSLEGQVANVEFGALHVMIS
jgi:hypothetical protein